MTLDSAMIIDAFKFLDDYGFHAEGHTDWRGSYAVFRRGRITLVVDFDTIALSSWLDLYDGKGENIAKIELGEALQHSLGKPAPPRALFSTSGDHRKDVEEIASAVKAHLMPVLSSEQAFWELHRSVYGTK